MQKCLGIYIEDNLIKYAKVSKEREDMKVESFGIRFFQDLSEEIKKIIEETYSFSTPISINLSDEKYLYFDVFALLNKKDIEESVKTEFESFCEERNYNKDAFETRYALMPDLDDKEKLRALNIYVNKIEYNKQIAPFERYKLTKVMPTSIAIANIARLNKRENELIINMEDTTTITTIYDNQIYEVETLDAGSSEVLEAINRVENSYAKAYEICKNTTIYTAESEELAEEQPYLQYIMPTIFKVAERVQEKIRDSQEKIQTIYLTGTLATINNIDLYFQEYLPNVECKVLKPKIVDEAITKINIKDYIEVNSAIALATVGLNEGILELNFRKPTTADKLSKFLTIELPNGKTIGGNQKINLNLKGDLSTSERWMVRAIVAILLILVIFMAFSKLLTMQMLDKEKEINDLIVSERQEIEKMKTDAKSLDAKTDKYKSLLADLNRTKEKISDVSSRRNTIPNLLNQIMSAIPNKVQLTSIENTVNRKIVITAQSADYEQLGYFVGIIKTKSILKNTVSSSSLKNGGIVSVTIEGDLP